MKIMRNVVYSGKDDKFVEAIERAKKFALKKPELKNYWRFIFVSLNDAKNKEIYNNSEVGEFGKGLDIESFCDEVIQEASELDFKSYYISVRIENAIR